jgi:hypothetical protein
VFLELPLAAVLWLSAHSLLQAGITSQLRAVVINAQSVRLRDLDLLPADTTVLNLAGSSAPMLGAAVGR